MNHTIISVWSAVASETRIAVWPDGCRDVIAIVEPERPTRVICTGLDSSVREVCCKAGTRFFGVRVAAGVSFPWDENDPASKNSDLAIPDLNRMLRRRGSAVDECPDTTLGLLEKAVQRWATPAPDWIAEYLHALWNGELGLDTAERFSERSFRRHVVQITGAPPRYWHGLARARRVAQELASSNDRLADIAVKYNFSDQAHMTRETMRWFNCTPTMLRKDQARTAEKLSAPDAFTAITFAR